MPGEASAHSRVGWWPPPMAREPMIVDHDSRLSRCVCRRFRRRIPRSWSDDGYPDVASLASLLPSGRAPLLAPSHSATGRSYRQPSPEFCENPPSHDPAADTEGKPDARIAAYEIGSPFSASLLLWLSKVVVTHSRRKCKCTLISQPDCY